jgi:prevent-host-death family protein
VREILVDAALSIDQNGRMKTVGAAYARTHFSRLVREARQGEVIIITRRGRPIARLRGLKPLPASAAETTEDPKSEEVSR